MDADVPYKDVHTYVCYTSGIVHTLTNLMDIWMIKSGIHSTAYHLLSQTNCNV